MKLTQLVLFFVWLVITSVAFSCSLTGEMAASNLRIEAILKYLNADKKYYERSVTKIIQYGPEEFLIETKLAGSNCQIVNFQATIESNCKVTIKPLKKKFRCE